MAAQDDPRVRTGWKPRAKAKACWGRSSPSSTRIPNPQPPAGQLWGFLRGSPSSPCPETEAPALASSGPQADAWVEKFAFLPPLGSHLRGRLAVGPSARGRKRGQQSRLQSPRSGRSWRPCPCSAPEPHPRLFSAEARSHPRQHARAGVGGAGWDLGPKPGAVSACREPRTGPRPGESAPVPGFPPVRPQPSVDQGRPTCPHLLFFYYEVLRGPTAHGKGEKAAQEMLGKAQRAHPQTAGLGRPHPSVNPRAHVVGMLRNPLESQRAPTGRTSELRGTFRGGFT